MTQRDRIAVNTERLADLWPSHPAVLRARQWLTQGTTYSNEDFNVLQGLHSALRESGLQPNTCDECGELAVGYDSDNGAALCAAHYRGKRLQPPN